MLRQLLQIPYIKDLVKRLRRERSLREAYGYHDTVPTEAHYTHMKKRVGPEGFRIIEAFLESEHRLVRVEGTGRDAYYLSAQLKKALDRKEVNFVAVSVRNKEVYLEKT